MPNALPTAAVKITFGSSLAALQHAYQNNTLIILNKLSFPDIFEPLHIREAWGLLYAKLMLAGKTIAADMVKATKVTDEKVTVVSEGNIINTFEYDILYVFDDEHIIGLSDIETKIDEYKVIDILKPIWLVAKTARSKITTKDSLVNTLYVLKSTQTSPINIYSVSYLNKEQLRNFDYSDTIVKFKSEDLLKQNGFLGRHPYREKIELEVVKRIIQKKMNKYKDSEKIKYIYGNFT